MDGKIGIFLNPGDDYHAAAIREIQESAQAEGLGVDVFDAEYTAAKQAHDLLRFEHDNAGKRLCAFVFPEADAIHEGDLGDDPSLHLAQRLLKKGVGWMVLNHGREAVIHRLREEFPGLPVALVAIDNAEFGRAQARQLRRLLPRGGTTLSVRGNPFDSACRDRSRGFKAELEGGGFTVEEIDGRWDPNTTEKGVHRWVSSPLRRGVALNAVVCQNDHMAISSRKALARAATELARPELMKLPVLGGDGLVGFGRRWVDEGTLTATVCVTLPGKPAVKQLVSYWREGSAISAVTKLGINYYPALNALSPIA